MSINTEKNKNFLIKIKMKNKPVFKSSRSTFIKLCESKFSLFKNWPEKTFLKETTMINYFNSIFE